VETHRKRGTSANEETSCVIGDVPKIRDPNEPKKKTIDLAERVQDDVERKGKGAEGKAEKENPKHRHAKWSLRN